MSNFPDMILPERSMSCEIADQLINAGIKQREGLITERDVEPLVEAIGAIPPEKVLNASADIASLISGDYFRYGVVSASVKKLSFLGRLFKKGRPTPLTQLLSVPKLEYLLLFHRNGHLREAALKKMSGGLPGSFWVAALAVRLNDWVPAVRRSASECALRVFPCTEPKFIAEAAFALMGRKANWSRWSSERAVLDDAFMRPEVLKHLIKMLVESRNGGAVSVLQQALRQDFLDHALVEIASKARMAAIRSFALQVLVVGMMRWPVGYEKQWVDKSMGVSRRARRFEERAIKVSRNLEDLIRHGLSDRSVLVRRTALDGLARHCSTIRDATALAQPFANDRRSSLRERADYILRHSVK